MLAFIEWAPSLTAFQIFGFDVRWYGLCWCLALGAGYLCMHWLYRDQKLGEKQFEPLFSYIFLGVLIGARLGHCLFYEPAYYLSHPVEMFLPFRHFPPPTGWKYIGYEGLASHGGTLGMMVAIWIYCRKTKVNIMRVLDNMGVLAPLSAAMIRIGNLMNSEIVGNRTDMPWGFIFRANGEDFARHPAQLYEALFYGALFVAFLFAYKSQKHRVGTGWFFGLCLASIFAFRFCIEFLKADQVSAEADMWLNIGQLLSVPFVAIGCYCMAGGKLCRKLGERK